MATNDTNVTHSVTDILQNGTFSTDFLFSTEPSNVTAPGEVKCAIFGGQEHLCDVIISARRAMASISMIGCLFVIAVIWLFRKYIVFAQRLILYLSIGAFCYCLFFIMGGIYEEGSFCSFQAWGITLFGWAVLLWVSCITFNLYMSVIHSTHTERFEWVYHMASWGLPFFLSFLPFIGDHYGPAGTWCWIKNNWAWRFGIWFCPLFIILILLICAYTYIILSINKKMKTWGGMYDPDVERHKLLLKEDVKPLKAYPFVYLLCSIFPLINRIQNAVSSTPVFGLVLMHALTSPLPGALNAVVFVLDKDTRSKLTWAQIRMSLLVRTSGCGEGAAQSVIREYPPVASSSAPYSQADQEPAKYHNISYSRLF